MPSTLDSDVGSWRGRRDGLQTARRGTLHGFYRPSRGHPANFLAANFNLEACGPAVDSIDIKTLLVEDNAPMINDAQYFASYNWLDVQSPVILVPGQPLAYTSIGAGSPPIWSPATDSQLKQDSASVFRDINAARYASHPVEPAVRSLLTLLPDFDFRSVDIVGCSSTLGNLLRFAGSQTRPFLFDIDVIGDTVFFVRKERSPTELITDLRGYRHTFPEEYTTWDAGVRNSCSHQCIIRYKFGGLDLLVRSETDGYVKKPGSEASNSATEADQPSLVDILRTMAVTSNAPDQNSRLQMKMAGTMVPQDQIFASNTIFEADEILPRLWVNQTPKFLIAYHKFGLFDKPEVKDVRDDVLAWEKTNFALLGRFHAVLKRILDAVRDLDTHQCEVYWDGQGPLCITKQVGEGRRALPSDLLQRLDGENKLATSLEASV